MKTYIDFVIVLGCIVVVAVLAFLLVRPHSGFGQYQTTGTYNVNGGNQLVATPTGKLSVLDYNKALDAYHKNPNPTTYRNVQDTVNRLQKQN